MTAISAILIAGPTASGKSALAIAKAKACNGVVVNADSMQVYDVLREITARPSPEEMDGVQHHLFGHVSPAENYNVATWLEEARAVAGEASAQGRVPVFVGGTGLYFKALLEGLSRIPHIDEEIRRATREAVNADPVGMHRELALVDPESAEHIDTMDSQRIARALEVFRSTGRRLGDWHEAERILPVFNGEDCEKLLLLPPRDVLRDRIATRFHQMVNNGALEEVREILAMKLSDEMPAMRAIGVNQLRDVILGKIALEHAITLSINATRQYAKRQTTWFRHQLSGEWQEIQSLDVPRHASCD